MSILKSVLKELLGMQSKSRVISISNSSFDAKVCQQEGGNILCFTAGSEGNALTELTRELMAPFEHKATNILFFDIGQSGWQDSFRAALHEPVWFAISFFGVGQDISITSNDVKKNLWEFSGIPFVRLYGDIPAYFPDRHVSHYSNSINSYFDLSHVKFYRRWFRDPALTILLPMFMINPLPLEQVDIDQKLSGKIIFAKNGNSPSALINYWRMSLPSSIAQSLEALAEESISKEWVDREPCFDDRLIQYFSRFGVEISAEPTLLCFMVAQLDDYVRRVKSTMIAEALLDLPVIIRGRFWEHVNFHDKRASYDPNSDFASTQSLIDNAPAIVDMSPNIQHAPHDRVRRAIGRGTAFLTNKQQFLDSVLPDTERFTFSFQREEIHNLVEHYVSNPGEAIDLGLEQARILRESFSIKNYVDSLLTAIHAMTLRQSGRPPGTQNFVDFPPSYFR